MSVTMTARWDDVGTVIPAGDAEYVVAEQPIAEYDNWINYNIVADIQKVIDDVINRFNANTILKADTNNTPAALVVAEQTIVGRKTGNSIAALTDSEVRAILNVEDGSDVTDSTNVNAAGAVMESDFNATTFLYATADNTPHPKNVAETLAIIGVEAGATADQTDTEIRDAVEAAVDSNTFTDADHAIVNDTVTKSIYNANSILKANSDNTPIAQVLPVQTLLGRASGGIAALTAAQSRALLNVADGADVTADNPPQSHGADKHTDRTRKFLACPHHHTTGDEESVGVALDQTTDQEVSYRFIFPTDFVSLTSVKVVHSSLDFDAVDHEWYLDVYAQYGEYPYSYKQHDNSSTGNAITMPAYEQEYIKHFTIPSATFADITKDDTVLVRLVRDANNVSDNFTKDIIIFGILVEYVSDM